MRCAIIAVLALAGCSSQPAVRSIGLHQYVVIDGGKQVFAKANETCTKLGRFALPMVTSAGADIPLAKRYTFECLSPFEIVPIDRDRWTLYGTAQKGDYRMWVPTSDITKGTPGFEPAPDTPKDFCARMHMTVKTTGGGLDLGTGLEVVFKCVPPG